MPSKSERDSSERSGVGRASYTNSEHSCFHKGLSTRGLPVHARVADGYAECPGNTHTVYASGRSSPSRRAASRREEPEGREDAKHKMDEAAMEKLMERVFKRQLAEAPWATNQDVDETKGTLDERAAKIAAIETPLQSAEAQASTRTPRRSTTPTPAPGRRSTASGRSTAATSDEAVWEPYVLHIKGFASLGCDVAQKLQKAEARAQMPRVRERLSESAASIQPMPPNAIDHMLSFRIVHGSAYKVARKGDSELQSHGFKIMGHFVAYRPEQSLERRALWHCLYKKVDCFNTKLQNDAWEKCARGTAILGKFAPGADGSPMDLESQEVPPLGPQRRAAAGGRRARR